MTSTSLTLAEMIDIQNNECAAKVTYCVTFSKNGWMRYISHLDLMRLFARAARRANFKLYLTKGFNPHPVIRIKKALKLGQVGRGLEAEFVLVERLGSEEFKRRLSEQLPEGIEIEKVNEHITYATVKERK